MKFLIISLSFIFIGCSNSSDDSPAVTTGSDNTTLETNQSSSNDINLDDVDVSKPNNGIIDVNQEESQTSRTENMNIGYIYKLEKNDIIREVHNADIQVVRNSENDFYEVILLSGKAQIIRK